MIAKKKNPRSGKSPKAKSNGVQNNWRNSLLVRLTKVPEIDGIFVAENGNTIHVFTVIATHDSKIYKRLLKQEDLVEKDHPSISFDFHTREHQGRSPDRAVPFDAEMVFVR
jgi:hypothetical protein